MSGEACQPKGQGRRVRLNLLYPELETRIGDEEAHGLAISHSLSIVGEYDPSQSRQTISGLNTPWQATYGSVELSGTENVHSAFATVGKGIKIINRSVHNPHRPVPEASHS